MPANSGGEAGPGEEHVIGGAPSNEGGLLGKWRLNLLEEHGHLDRPRRSCPHIRRKRPRGPPVPKHRPEWCQWRAASEYWRVSALRQRSRLLRKDRRDTPIHKDDSDDSNE